MIEALLNALDESVAFREFFGLLVIAAGGAIALGIYLIVQWWRGK